MTGAGVQSTAHVAGATRVTPVQSAMWSSAGANGVGISISSLRSLAASPASSRRRRGLCTAILRAIAASHSSFRSSLGVGSLADPGLTGADRSYTTLNSEIVPSLLSATSQQPALHRESYGRGGVGGIMAVPPRVVHQGVPAAVPAPRWPEGYRRPDAQF